MQSFEIVALAIAAIAVGAVALRYQATGRRRFELAIIVFGVAALGSGLAMFRDGVAGSRQFLWMLPQPASALTADAMPTTVAARGVDAATVD